MIRPKPSLWYASWSRGIRLHTNSTNCKVQNVPSITVWYCTIPYQNHTFRVYGVWYVVTTCLGYGSNPVLIRMATADGATVTVAPWNFKSLNQYSPTPRIPDRLVSDARRSIARTFESFPLLCSPLSPLRVW